MEELYKDINRWILEQRVIKQNEEIVQLADILVEGFMGQWEGKQNESLLTGQNKPMEEPLQGRRS